MLITVSHFAKSCEVLCCVLTISPGKKTIFLLLHINKELPSVTLGRDHWPAVALASFSDPVWQFCPLYFVILGRTTSCCHSACSAPSAFSSSGSSFDPSWIFRRAIIHFLLFLLCEIILHFAATNSSLPPWEHIFLGSLLRHFLELLF